MPQFSPPSHEEPMRCNIEPLKHFRLTYAPSVVRVNGVLKTVRSPSAEMIAAAGIEGVDYFRGGCVYGISAATATELEAAGFVVDHTAGYGLGPFGLTPYGE